MVSYRYEVRKQGVLYQCSKQKTQIKVCKHFISAVWYYGWLCMRNSESVQSTTILFSREEL